MNSDVRKVLIVGFHDFYTRKPHLKIYKLPVKKRLQLYVDYKDFSGSYKRIREEYEKLIRKKQKEIEYIGAIGHPVYTIVALELAYKYNLQFCIISQNPSTKEIVDIIPFTPVWEWGK
jgi:hypothetical protein